MPTDLPEVRRVSFADHAAKAADLLVKPDDAGRVAAAACRLEPLQRIQVAFDQLVNHAEGHRRGELGPYGHDFHGYAKAELEGAKRHVEVLAVASEAAIAMHKDMTAQLRTLEDAMSKKKDDEQKLTTDGSPHPLQEGGYDPAKDPQLPSNISDVEALKEGKTTHAQNEAIARADAEANGGEGKEPTKAEGSDAQREPAKPAPTPPPTPKTPPVVQPVVEPKKPSPPKK